MENKPGIIDVEVVEPASKIVRCPKCSSKNRIRHDSGTAGYRCGNCHEILPKPLAQRSPILAFVLTFLTGPIGFFYVSWRTGVMSCIAFVLAALIWFGLNETTIPGWLPIWPPTLEIPVSFAIFSSFTIFYALLQQAFLGFWCTTLIRARNNSLQIGDNTGFATGHRLFRLSVAVPYGLILIVPWVLNDALLGITCVIHAKFFWGLITLAYNLKRVLNLVSLEKLMAAAA